MYAKLFCLLVLAVVALASARAREYPAGLHPAVCPNYPFCDTNTWTKFTPEGQPIPEWVYNPSILPVAPADPYGPTKYPAGVNPALCPNYPHCP